MNEKYIKQLYDFIGGKDAGFDYDAFKNDISTNEEYNKEIFDYAYGEQEGIDYNAYAFDTGLKKKEQSDSNSSQEPTPSSEATTTSESVGEEPKNDLYADVEAAQSAQDYKEPIVEVPNRLVAEYGRQGGDGSSGLRDASDFKATQEKDTAFERQFGKNEFTDFFGDIYRSASSGWAAGKTVDESFDVFKGKEASDAEIMSFIEKSRELEGKGQTDEMQALSKKMASLKEEGYNGVSAFFGAWWDNPSAMLQYSAMSLAQMASALTDSEEVLGTAAAAAGVGAATGAAIGLAGGPFAPITSTAGAITGSISGFLGGLSGAMETAMTTATLIQEKAVEEGLDWATMSDKKRFDYIRKLQNNEEEFNDLKSKAASRGLAIGAIDAITAGVTGGAGSAASRTVAKGARSSLAGAARVGTVASVETGGGMLSEVAGQAAAKQKYNLEEILIEGFADKTFTGVSIIQSLSQGAPKYSINGEKMNGKQFIDNIKILDDEVFFTDNAIKVENSPAVEKLISNRRENIEADQYVDSRISDVTDRTTAINLVKEQNRLKNNPTGNKTRLTQIKSELDGIAAKYADSQVDATIEKRKEAVANAVANSFEASFNKNYKAPAETEERIGYNNPKNPRFNEKLSGETETKETPVKEDTGKYTAQPTEELEQRMFELENSKDKKERDEFNEIEKELENREWGSVINAPLSEVESTVDELVEKEKSMPNGFGSFIEKADATETKEVAKKYSGEVSKADAKKDFDKAFNGSPSTWYADALKLKESVRVFIEQGGTFKELLQGQATEYTKDGFTEEEAASVIGRKLEDIKRQTDKSQQESQVKPDVATTEGKDVVTPEILEQGKKEVTDVTKGTFSTANPVKIFKGIGGKKDLQGFRINAHKGAKGVFSSVDSELAATYGRDEGVAEVVIPKGTSIEVVEVDGTGMGMSDYRAAEVKAINNSDAQIVKLITIDGVMRAGEKRQQQYVIKDDSLIEGLKKEESPTSPEAKEEVQAKPDVVDTKSEKEAPIEKEESPRLEIDLDESTKSWVPKKLNSALEGIRVGLQDRWYRLRKTIRLARKAGAVISDEIDAYTKRELQSGKVSEKVTKFKELIIKSKPNQKNALLEDMQEDGVTNLDEFGLFLYAQHAPERNQTLKDRAVEEGREDTEGLSGMTNEQAQEIIESMPKDKLAKYKEYAKRFREEVILPSIDELENSELINSELANTLRTKWKNYVPLMVEEFVSDKAKYPSPKFSVRGKDIYKAKGSNFYDNKSRVNPFISGIERYINYASRAEENRTFQSLVGLVEKINNPDILKVIRPKYEPVRDTDGNTVYVRRKFENEAGKNLVEGKIDGKPVLIEVVNKNLFDALENSTISLNKVEQVLNAVNSYLRAVNTLMNPEFIVRNFVRDIQTAFINISAEDAKGMAAQMVKNVPSAIRGIIDNQRGNETEWSKIYQELKDEGGDVSWLEANDLTKIKKDIDASIKRYDKSSTKRNLIRALESIGGGWNTSMKATEMATRVAAYKTAIDKGYSKQKAASLAKNLTVNFEKKGVYGNLINSLYLFANAGIQGSAVIFKAMSKKGVGGNRARALAGSIIGMSFLNAMINDWVDDDDEVDKLTEVDKERNMIFMLPNKERVTIPLPYGYNLLWVTGQLSYDMASGNKTAGDAMASFLRAFDGAFNPLSSGNLGQMFTPTIAGQ